jgi:hypothetical protein
MLMDNLSRSVAINSQSQVLVAVKRAICSFSSAVGSGSQTETALAKISSLTSA